MARDRKKDRISRIRNNLKYENDDPIWKKLFYITENLKQYKGVVIALGITVFLVILAIFFSTMSKNSVRKNDIVITEQVNTGNVVEKKKEFGSTEDIEKYIDEITQKVLKEGKISEDERKLREFLVRLYRAGGYSSKNTYIQLLKKLNPTYNIGKISEENNVLHIIITKKEDGKDKEEVINVTKILELLDFRMEVLAAINKKRIDEKAFKYDDIILDVEMENDKLLKFKEIVTKDVKEEQEIANTQNTSNTQNVSNTGQVGMLPPYSEVKDTEVEIRFADDNSILERYTIEKGSVPKFQRIPRKDGYLFVEWDKNIFTKVYENTTYVAKWISYKDLGTRIVCFFDLDGGIGTFPSAIVEKGTTITEIIEKNGLSTPLKPGYIFKGWSVESATKIEEDTVIKALWSRVE